MRLKMLAAGTLSLKTKHSARQRRVVVPGTRQRGNRGRDGPGSGKIPVTIPMVMLMERRSEEIGYGSVS